jgi:hypothetical protein
VDSTKKLVCAFCWVLGDGFAVCLAFDACLAGWEVFKLDVAHVFYQSFSHLSDAIWVDVSESFMPKLERGSCEGRVDISSKLEDEKSLLERCLSDEGVFLIVEAAVCVSDEGGDTLVHWHLLRAGCRKPWVREVRCGGCWVLSSLRV